jgi:hypothetical protein
VTPILGGNPVFIGPAAVCASIAFTNDCFNLTTFARPAIYISTFKKIHFKKVEQNISKDCVKDFATFLKL